MAQTYGIQGLKTDFRRLANTDDITRTLFFTAAYNAWNNKTDKTITAWEPNLDVIGYDLDCIINGQLVMVGPKKAEVPVNWELYNEISCEHHNSKSLISPLEIALIKHFKRSIRIRFDKLAVEARQYLGNVIHEIVYDKNCNPHKVLLPDSVHAIGEKALSFYFGEKKAANILTRAEKLSNEKAEKLLMAEYKSRLNKRGFVGFGVLFP